LYASNLSRDAGNSMTSLYTQAVADAEAQALSDSQTGGYNGVGHSQQQRQQQQQHYQQQSQPQHLNDGMPNTGFGSAGLNGGEAGGDDEQGRREKEEELEALQREREQLMKKLKVDLNIPLAVKHKP
jgi:lysophospholipase L1-like esterase